MNLNCQTPTIPKRTTFPGIVAAGLLCFLALHAPVAAADLPAPIDTNSPVSQALQKAGKLFEQQHWAKARAAYDEARGMEKDWSAPPVRLAVEGAVACSLKLQTWDDALSRAAEFVTRAKGTFAEAVGERFLGGLYLSVPHYGTKRGTTFLRGQWAQGVQVYSWRKDSKDALKHYERARELVLALPAKAEEEKKLLNVERFGLRERKPERLPLRALGLVWLVVGQLARARRGFRSSEGGRLRGDPLGHGPGRLGWRGSANPHRHSARP
jgi:hypothetical protein